MVTTLLSLFIGSLILYLPVSVMLRARKFDVHISLYDALLLSIRKTATKELFEAFGMAEKNTLNVYLPDLEVHLLAGGNPVRVVKTLIKYKDCVEISPKQVFAYDLAEQDFDAFAKQLLKTHTVSLKNIDFSIFKIDYKAVFKLSSDSLLLDEGSHSTEDHITHKLQLLSKEWGSTDPRYTQSFLITQVVNNRFWNNEIKAKLISQKLSVHDETQNSIIDH